MRKSGTLRTGSLYVIALAMYLTAATGHAASTALVSITKDGTQGNHYSLYPSLSADGRYVVFGSVASNLVPDDRNGRSDVFVVDRTTGDMQRVSVSSDGAEGNGISEFGLISADGRYVAFGSTSSNLVPGDTNNLHDIFVHDRVTGTTERVSNGAQAGNVNFFAISGDGRYVAFMNWDYDLIVYDRQTGTAEYGNVWTGGAKMRYGGSYPSLSIDGRYLAFQGTAGDGSPYTQALYVRDRVQGTTTPVRTFTRRAGYYMGVTCLIVSDDGRFLAYSSWDGTIVPGDTNGYNDVFLQDLAAGTTERVSVSSSGAEGNSASVMCAMSADGRYVVFDSVATNLIADDTNGWEDVFRYDRETKTTERVSVTSTGGQSGSRSGLPAISADGSTIAYYSFAENLVPCDRNQRQDIFVYDRSGTPDDFNGCGARNRPPVADAGPDHTVGCALTSPVAVSLDGSRSSDPDNDPLTYRWSWSGGSATGAQPTVMLSAGITPVTLVVNDGTADSAPATVVVTVELDAVPPVTALQRLAGTAGNEGWYRSPVDFSLLATDNCSGVREVHYSLDGIAVVAPGSSASSAIPADGVHSLSFFAVDNASNQEAPRPPVSIMIDGTAPAITAATDHAANAAGWISTDVTVSFHCFDATSGVASCTGPMTVASEGANQLITGTAADRAGNSAATVVTLNIDKTAPAVDLTVTPAFLWPPNHKPVAVTVGGSAVDGGSGIAAIEITVTDEYGTYQPAVPGFGRTIWLEASRNGDDRDGRMYTITAVVTDKAGNRSTATATVLVPHDQGHESGER